MNTNINNKGGRRFVASTALLVLSLSAAIVLVAPALVFAQITGALSQECDFALIGTEHSITAEVTDAGVMLLFDTKSPDVSPFIDLSDENGMATFPYTVESLGEVETSLWFLSSDGWEEMESITTTWTDDEADLCSDSPVVADGGEFTLKVKKKGALKIVLCAADNLDVSNIDLTTVNMAGVAPRKWKQKDSRLCSDKKDGVVDLVLIFKNWEVVKALEDNRGKLADGDRFDLVVTGSMNDGTPFEYSWDAKIKKKDKMHQKKDKKGKGFKK